MTTFYRCPTCATYWSDEPIPADPAERHNGGAVQCRDCRAAQHAYDDDRADAYYG